MAVTFQDSERAARNLGTLAERLSPATARLLENLLDDSPDPDAALNLFERLTEQAESALLQLFDRQPFLVHYALTVFGYSQYLGETLVQNSDLLPAFAREKSFDRSYGREDYRERLTRFLSRTPPSNTDSGALAERLALFKKREYIRIMLRDVLTIAPLAEVTGEISALADVLISHALEASHAVLRARVGEPQTADAAPTFRAVPIAVLSLGKLGGDELNYSSDVDLMFLFGDGDAPPGSALPWREYFIRLAQTVTAMLSQPTREGAIFRIDLRLRPQGNEGEPALALSHALRYYDEVAHDWELQALIKARHTAGDIGIARQFIRGVQPRIYRGGLNFHAVETALASRERISSRRRYARTLTRIPLGLDVKLDRGGIRDIEFLVQCLQRVYGGEEIWLRSGGTLFSLQKLHDKGHISGQDFHQLTQAYEFLRRLEHRLQLRHGQQTHRLPASPPALEVLARSMGARAGGGAIDDPHTLLTLLHQHMGAVTAIYQRLVHAQRSMQQRAEAEPEFALRPAPAPEGGVEDSYSQILHRLSTDSPPLYQLAARRDLSSRTRRNLFRFLASALTSSQRYAAVLNSATAVEQALSVFESSDHLSDILVRHPEEITVVAEIAGAQHVGHAGELHFTAGSQPVQPDSLAGATTHPERLALIRRSHRRRTFASGVTDLLAPRSVFQSLAAATATADTAIATALEVACSEALRGDGRHIGFSIAALGRLGTREFDAGSDADLLFLRDDSTDAELARRLAEQVVGILTAYTQEGSTFAVDTRLRPLGAEGELVTTPSALEQYLGPRGDAQAWEALTFTKLRLVCSSGSGAESLTGLAAKALHRFAVSSGFLPQVLEMREKLAQADAARNLFGFNFKTAAGGFYDIDFIVTYLFVRHSLVLPGSNIRERLHHLAAHDLLDDAACATLDYAAELLRTTDHVIRLVTGRARKSLPAGEHGREAVEHLTARLMESDFEGGLEAELRRVAASVRELYQRLMQ